MTSRNSITEAEAIAAARRVLADPRYARFSLLEQFGVCALLVQIADAQASAAVAAAEPDPASDTLGTAFEKDFHDGQK